MNNNFKEHVTQTAFSLSISTRMIEMLSALHHNVEYYHYGHFITTGRSLSKRGLVFHVKGEGYILTEAGDLVCALLKEANMLAEKERLVEVIEQAVSCN